MKCFLWGMLEATAETVIKRGTLGRPVSKDDGSRNQRPAALGDRRPNEHPPAQRAHQVRHSRARLTMRPHIDRPKLRKSHRLPFALDNILGGSYNNFILAPQ